MAINNPFLFKETVTSVLEDIRRMHIMDYNEAAQLKKVAQAATELEGQVCGNGMQDVFLSLYNSDPALREQVEAKLNPLRTMMDIGMQSPDWQSLKDYTTGDIVSSGLAGASIARRMYDALPDEAKGAAQEQCQHQTEADEAKEAVQDMQSVIDAYTEILENLQTEAESLKTRNPQTEQEAAQMEAALDELAQKIGNASGKISEAQEGMGSMLTRQQAAQGQADSASTAFEEAMAGSETQIKAAYNQAIQETHGDTKKTMEFVKAFSLAAGGTGVVDPATVEQAMKVISVKPSMAELAKFLGFAKEAVFAAYRESAKAPNYPSGYKADELNISRMIPSELMNMTGAAGESRRMDFFRRAAEGEILHRDYEGETPENRGDCYIIRDESGSMNDNDHNFAIGIEYALNEVMRREKNRDLTSFPFSGYNQWHEFKYPRNGENLEGLAQHLTSRYNGGTEPYGPLAAALNKIIKNDVPADILVITDAVIPAPNDQILAKLVEARKSTKTKIIAVAIGIADTSHLEAWADVVIPVTTLWAGKEQVRVALTKLMQ